MFWVFQSVLFFELRKFPSKIFLTWGLENFVFWNIKTFIPGSIFWNWRNFLIFGKESSPLKFFNLGARKFHSSKYQKNVFLIAYNFLRVYFFNFSIFGLQMHQIAPYYNTLANKKLVNYCINVLYILKTKYLIMVSCSKESDS